MESFFLSFHFSTTRAKRLSERLSVTTIGLCDQVIVVFCDQVIVKRVTK
jgi:hypothetical protein